MRPDGKSDSTTRRKGRGHDRFSRGTRFKKIVENPIRHRLIESAIIAERSQVKFQRFAFDTPLGRNVVDLDFGEIGLSGYGTQGSEIVCLEMDPEIATSGISERFQCRRFRRYRHGGMAVPEKSEITAFSFPHGPKLRATEDDYEGMPLTN